MPENFRTIGKNVLRKEGIPKVTGRAVYADDMRVENCLYGRTIRSSIPHGIITEIRFKPGIPWSDFTIVLPKDIPGLNAVTLIDTEQPFLATREVQHLAEPMALIAHPDKELLDKAMREIEVDFETLPAVFTMDEALVRNDIFKSYVIENGDPAEKWRDAQLIVEETYRTGAQE